MPDSPFSVAAKHDMTSKEYADAYFNFKDKGYRLQCVSGYEEGSAIKFAAVWKKEIGSPLASFHQLTGAEYQEKYNLYDGQGFKLTFVNAFWAQGKVWLQAYVCQCFLGTGQGVVLRHLGKKGRT